MTQQNKPDEDQPKEPIKVSFSLPQITGGALAAATAAALGSSLGTAGTIFGAAVASVIGGIAGTLYSAGIDRTHRKVTEAIQRGYERVRTEDRPTQQLPATDAETQVLTDAGLIFRDSADDLAQTRVDLSPVDDPGGDGNGRKPVWKVMAITIAAIFLLALVVVTALELGLGRALDGSDGTTVSQVVRRPSSTPTPTPTPARPTPARPTPSATTPTEPATPTITPTEPTPTTPTTPTAPVTSPVSPAPVES